MNYLLYVTRHICLMGLFRPAMYLSLGWASLMLFKGRETLICSLNNLSSSVPHLTSALVRSLDRCKILARSSSFLSLDLYSFAPFLTLPRSLLFRSLDLYSISTLHLLKNTKNFDYVYATTTFTFKGLIYGEGEQPTRWLVFFKETPH